MTLNGKIHGYSLKIQLMQKGSLLLLAAMASLFLAFQRHSGITLGVVLAIATVVVPVGYVLMRRVTERLRQHEMEEHLMTHTRAYLRNEEPARAVRARSAIHGKKKPAIGDFLEYQCSVSTLPVDDSVVFNAFSRRYATLNFCDRRFANGAAVLPEPAFLPLRDLWPALATQESGS